MKTKLQRMLNAPDKEMGKTYGANGVLSRLFRVMLADLNIGGIRFGALLQDYIMDSTHGVPNNKKDQTSIRGNLTKEFSRVQMTWKVFCKALRFLQLVKADFYIHAHHADGRVTIHHTTVDFGRRDQTKEFNEQLEQTEEQEATGLPAPVLDYYEEEAQAKAAASGTQQDQASKG